MSDKPTDKTPDSFLPSIEDSWLWVFRDREQLSDETLHQRWQDSGELKSRKARPLHSTASVLAW